VTGLSGRPLARTRVLATLVLAGAVAGLSPRAVRAESAPLPVLTAAQQLAIARVFAPTLVYHPLELYFPTSSMGVATIEPWPARVEQYRALSTQEKMDRATLAYRVFPRLEDGQIEVIVEYWCYYVYNAYTIRGAWLPYRASDNHPHDLERLYVVLRAADLGWPDDGAAGDAWAREAFQIVRVVANAHDGSIPPNQYRVGEGEALRAPLSILVERGSHAMAPDINRDGRFTPNIDNSEVSKVRWGIRDNGSTWRWYLQHFMDVRDASAVRLCGPVASPAQDPPACPRYSLYPADDLQRWFQELQLSARDREDVVGRTSWVVRTFGDFRVEHLMAPLDAADGREFEKMLRRRKVSETGFVAGFTTVDHTPALVLSRRYFWEVPSPRYPDILAEAVAIFPNDRRTLFETTVWGSYNIDAITNALIGYGWFTERHLTSPIIAAEVRVGRFRIRPSWRLRDNGFDTRITTTF